MYHMPYGVVIEENNEAGNEVEIITIPCQTTKGVIELSRLMGNFTFMDEAKEFTYFWMTCSKNFCVVYRVRRGVKSGQGYWFANNETLITFEVSPERLKVCDYRKCRTFGVKFELLVIHKESNHSSAQIENPQKLCGYLGPDGKKLTEAVVHNFTHYIKDFEMKRYSKSYECSVHVEMLSDVAGIIHGLTQIIDFVVHSIIGFVMIIFDFLVSLTFSLEDIIEQVLKALVYLLLMTIDVIIDILMRSQYFVEITITLSAYALLYNIHRDNWITLMLLFGTIAAIRVIKNATHQYDV